MKAVTGFRPLKSVYTASHGIPTIPYLIDDSATLLEGSAVKLVGGLNGIAPADAAGDVVFGYVKAFITKGQHPLQTVSDNPAYVDGTYTAAPSGDTYVAASDNRTDKQIMALIVPAFGVICSVKGDATPGTTANSNFAGGYIDILAGSSVLLDESSIVSGIANYLTQPSQPGSQKCVDEFDGERFIVMAAETQQGVSVGATA